MKTLKNQQAINEVLNLQHLDGHSFLKNLVSFTEWADDAQPFLIEVGKQARAISNSMESFPIRMMMKEIEQCYFSALHADCDFILHTYCSKALGWLNAMIIYRETGKF